MKKSRPRQSNTTYHYGTLWSIWSNSLSRASDYSVYEIETNSCCWFIHSRRRMTIPEHPTATTVEQFENVQELGTAYLIIYRLICIITNALYSVIDGANNWIKSVDRTYSGPGKKNQSHDTLPTVGAIPRREQQQGGSSGYAAKTRSPAKKIERRAMPTTAMDSRALAQPSGGHGHRQTHSR